MAARLCCTLLVFVLMYTGASGSKASCRYDSTPRHALYGRNLKTLRDIALQDCSDACTIFDRCLSFDYNTHTRSCFLNDQTKTTAPDMFGSHLMMTYYEKKDCSGIDGSENVDDEDNEVYSGDDGSGSGSGDGYNAGHADYKPHWINGQWVYAPEMDSVFP